jgi:hypothetical protein
MKLQDKIKRVKDEDFLPGFFDSWGIFYRENEFVLEKRYMNIGFPSEIEAIREKERMIKHRDKQSKPPYYSIEVRHSKVRRLKKPISVG